MAGASLHYRKAVVAIHDVLINEWDPIGIGDEAPAHDEYDSYVPVIYRLLVEGVSDEVLAQHLEQLVRDSIGLAPKPERELRIGRRLREAINQIAPGR
jgi:hypothetical protein